MKRAINCEILLLAGVVTATAAQARSVAIGDSLAVGFGQASHVLTIARVGEPSCPNRHRAGILNMMPAENFDTMLISAGTNDAPGNCIEQIRAKAHARRVIWVVPVNRARQHVIKVASEHGDGLLFYSPSKHGWPHPAHYWKVL